MSKAQHKKGRVQPSCATFTSLDKSLSIYLINRCWVDIGGGGEVEGGDASSHSSDQASNQRPAHQL